MIAQGLRAFVLGARVRCGAQACFTASSIAEKVEAVSWRWKRPSAVIYSTIAMKIAQDEARRFHYIVSRKYVKL